MRLSTWVFQVWRHGGVGHTVPEGCWRGEPEAVEVAGRADAGQLNAEGNAGEKLLTPSSRRDAVNWAITDKGYFG